MRAKKVQRNYFGKNRRTESKESHMKRPRVPFDVAGQLSLSRKIERLKDQTSMKITKIKRVS